MFSYIYRFLFRCLLWSVVVYLIVLVFGFYVFFREANKGSHNLSIAASFIDAGLAWAFYIIVGLLLTLFASILERTYKGSRIIYLLLYSMLAIAYCCFFWGMKLYESAIDFCVLGPEYLALL